MARKKAAKAKATAKSAGKKAAKPNKHHGEPEQKKAGEQNKRKNASAKNAVAVGKILHFYDKINVAAVEMTGTLNKGDRIEVIRPVHVLAEQVQSIQLNRKNITSAKKGQVIGMKLNAEVRKGDVVYKVG